MNNVSGERPVLVDFVDVRKTFDGKVNAVEQLNLDVRAGEFLTFLGPSGSGKTTTLLLLAGFEEPTGGDIRVNGRSINRTPPHKRNFGMVFQNYALFPHMDVIENVAFPLTVRGVARSEAAARAARAIDLVQLKGLEGRRPNQLSGGQQQRIALARALVFDPTLVLMDEPFGALDKKLRETMQMEVKHIHERLGNTMISVTHDQSEALTMSDRVAVFNLGKIQQIGTPKEIYQRPRNLFVAQFVGEINTIEGRIVDRDGTVCRIALPDGRTVQASMSAAINVGDAVVLTLRPEMIAVNPAEGDCDNTITGQIIEVAYWGDHIRIFVDVGLGAKWMVKATGANGRLLEPGQPITVGWRTSDSLALSVN